VTGPLDFDFVVIGSGPAGQQAALQAARVGKRVAMIERDRHLGGACVQTGTIPSKILRQHALHQKVRRVDLSQSPLKYLLDGASETIVAHDAFMAAQLERHQITLLRGRARFTSARELRVERTNGAQLAVAARHVVIATGSRPMPPAHLAVDHANVFDSDSVLSLAYLPRSLLVLGGGVVASEYSSMFAALGCHVVQADPLGEPLAFLDPELTAFYLEELRHHGGEYLGGASVKSLRWDGVSQVHAEFEDGRHTRTDKVLVALGRAANIEGLDLEAAGIAVYQNGHVCVDENFETTAPGVFAAGDVIGPPALASVSMEQGRRAAAHALGLLVPMNPVSCLPAGIYTLPEIATVGLDEHGARRHFGGALVGRARFEDIARGQIDGAGRGLLKLIADGGGRRVVGVQIAGEGANELIHIGQLGLSAEMDVNAYVENVFGFPTMAEAYRVAALDIVQQRERGLGIEDTAAAVAAAL
jgi:NAD(P) transhydrogenase